MIYTRTEPGSYKGFTIDAEVVIDRDDCGKWFWTVQHSGGGTSGGIQYTLRGAKISAEKAITDRWSK